jgi:hypothetical protein
MKILLLGDFSSLHKNLKDGLLKNGHEVTLVSSGDGWKKIENDVDISMRGSSLYHKIIYRLNLIKAIFSFKNYDVIQFVSPYFFPVKLFPFKTAIWFLKVRNKSLFLSASGSDAYYWAYGRANLRYSPHLDYLKYDLETTSHLYESKKWLDANRYLVSKVDGVIPIMYEYENCYSSCEKRMDTIPIPMNVEKIPYKDNYVNDKVIVFHGLSRYGFKGTRHVEEAFEILKDKYSDEAEFIIDGKMPLDEYLLLMEKTHIVIDQTYSYSLGVNGIYALAMGKVVLGGAEHESLLSLGVMESPVINILPEASDIIKKIECLLLDKDRIREIGKLSRDFSEDVHSYKKIASKYIDAWCSVSS